MDGEVVNGQSPSHGDAVTAPFTQGGRAADAATTPMGEAQVKRYVLKRRAYQLLNIEDRPIGAKGSQHNAISPVTLSTDTTTIADLIEIVKQSESQISNWGIKKGTSLGGVRPAVFSHSYVPHQKCLMVVYAMVGRLSRKRIRCFRQGQRKTPQARATSDSEIIISELFNLVNENISKHSPPPS